MRTLFLVILVCCVGFVFAAPFTFEDAIVREQHKEKIAQAQNDIFTVAGYNKLSVRDKTELLLFWRLAKELNPSLTKAQFATVVKNIRIEARKKFSDIDWTKVNPS